MVVESVILSVIANYVFEWSKTFKVKLKSDDIQNTVQGFLHSFENTILDSGAFDEFLHLTETKIDFQNFIEYGIYKDILKEERLTKSKFITIISSRAHSYINKHRNANLKEIPILELEKYFNLILDLIEQNLISHMSKDLKYNNYLLRVKIDELVERIENAKNYKTCIEEGDIKSIRVQYIKMMKEKYKTVHIYGIDELGFNTFYIKPSFSISLKENELDPIVKNIVSSKENILVNWEKIFIYSNIVSVIGGAGFGKTLFLKNMINDFQHLDTPESKELLPIYCDLKKFAEKIRVNMSYTIKNFLIDSMKYDTSINEINQSFLDYYLEKGICLILFDALDEVDKAERVNIYTLIVSFFENINKNNKVCITSRERGFIPKTKIIYRVNTVNEDDVDQYVNKLININRFNPDYKVKFLDECKSLIENKFLQSFLMLSLLVNIYKAERRMPKSKIDLYQKSIEYISKEREMGISGECIKKANINFNLIESIINTDESFERLAYLAKPNNDDVKEERIINEFLDLHSINYTSNNETLLAIKEFLRFCTERTELFVKSSDKEYKFYHKSFFEYFYSKFMINNLDLEKLCKELCSFDSSQEIPEMVIELLRSNKFSDYKKFVNIVFGDIKNGDLKFIEAINILIYFEEPGYLSELYDMVFSDEKLLNISIIDSVKGIDIGSRYLGLCSIMENILQNKKILKDKNLYNDIKFYYKEEYLKVMFILYIKKRYLLEEKTEIYIFKLKHINVLAYVCSVLGNIFDKKDFNRKQAIEVLKTIEMENSGYRLLNIKEKMHIINEFYDKVYTTNTKDIKKYIAVTSE